MTESSGRRSFVVIFVSSALLLAAENVAGQSPRVHADFNGDGFADLAVGAPREDINLTIHANDGAVNVIYATAAGLSATRNQFWTQNSAGILDTAEVADAFGAALAAGDFNGDGFADLAIGVPGEDVGTVTDSGGVNVIYGSATGLSASGNQFWTQNSSGVLGTAERAEYFGFALAVGDFNRDGFADLAVGVPTELLGSSGGVNVLYGSAAKLTATGDQLWTQNSSGVLDTAEGLEHFGAALTAADFNGDGYSDLAIGVPKEDVGAPARVEGSVNVLYGSASGLSATRNQLWSQNSSGILDAAEFLDAFGAALAAADFNGDGFADLAVGVPGEDIGTLADAGGINVIYGSASGLSAIGNQFWSQNSSGILDTSEPRDRFGSVLAAANFGKTMQADLAVGVPGEDLGAITDAGGVNVLYGSIAGLAASGNQFWSQDASGVSDRAEQSDGFGLALAAADFGKTVHADLAIGVPGENLEITPSVGDAGGVHVLYGSATGLSATGTQFWTQNSSNIQSVAGSDSFGGALMNSPMLNIFIGF